MKQGTIYLRVRERVTRRELPVANQIRHLGGLRRGVAGIGAHGAWAELSREFERQSLRTQFIFEIPMARATPLEPKQPQ
jgi:hypothetical protein